MENTCISNVLNELDRSIDALDCSLEKAKECYNTKDFEEYKKIIAEILFDIHTRCRWPIYKQFPEMAPKYLRDRIE